MLGHSQSLTLAFVTADAITVSSPGVVSVSHTLQKGYRKPFKSRCLFFPGVGGTLLCLSNGSYIV